MQKFHTSKKLRGNKSDNICSKFIETIQVGLNFFWPVYFHVVWVFECEGVWGFHKHQMHHHALKTVWRRKREAEKCR